MHRFLRFSKGCLTLSLFCSVASHIYANEAPDKTVKEEVTSKPYYANEQDNYFYFAPGLFGATIDTSLKIDNKSSLFSKWYDFENDLGLQEKRALWNITMGYRFHKKHNFEFAFLEFDRDGERTVIGAGAINDLSFKVGAILETDVDINIYQFNYGYSFYQTDKWDIAAMIGLYWYAVSIDVDLAGYAQIGSGPAESIDTSDQRSGSSKFNAPLPSIGFDIDYNITPEWLLTSRLMWLGISVGDYSGSIKNIAFGIRKNITPNVFAGFNYTVFDIDFTKDSDDIRVDFEYIYQGPMLYIGYQL